MAEDSQDLVVIIQNNDYPLQGLSMVLSKSQLSPSEESMDFDIADTNRQYRWLLTDLPALPTFSHVRRKTCNALRQVRFYLF